MYSSVNSIVLYPFLTAMDINIQLLLFTGTSAACNRVSVMARCQQGKSRLFIDTGTCI